MVFRRMGLALLLRGEVRNSLSLHMGEQLLWSYFSQRMRIRRSNGCFLVSSLDTDISSCSPTNQTQRVLYPDLFQPCNFWNRCMARLSHSSVRFLPQIEVKEQHPTITFIRVYALKIDSKLLAASCSINGIIF